jgi:hypothetical protein
MLLDMADATRLPRLIVKFCESVPAVWLKPGVGSWLYSCSVKIAIYGHVLASRDILFVRECFELRSQKCEKRLVASSCLSVCRSVRQPVCPWNNWAPTGPIFTKFCIWAFFENLVRKVTFYWNLTRIMVTLLEDQFTFLYRICSVRLRMRNVSDKSCVENQNTHFVFSNYFSKTAKTLWDNVEK